MVMGYGIIAVPTGIVTLELNEPNRRQANMRPFLTARQRGTPGRRAIVGVVAQPYTSGQETESRENLSPAKA